MYCIELATGLRRGELLGLKWEDLDLDQGSLRVQRQVSRINGEVVEAPLKTKNSYRTISLGADAVEILKEQRKKCGDSPYVFPSPTGGPISPDSVLNILHRVLKRAGLPKVRFHDLRHTFATLALQNGVDIKTVSSLRNAGSLQRRVYPGHLCPRYHCRAEAGSKYNGSNPLRHSPAVKNFSGAFPVWVTVWVKTRLGKVSPRKKFRKQRKPAVFIQKRDSP